MVVQPENGVECFDPLVIKTMLSTNQGLLVDMRDPLKDERAGCPFPTPFWWFQTSCFGQLKGVESIRSNGCNWGNWGQFPYKSGHNQTQMEKPRRPAEDRFILRG